MSNDDRMRARYRPSCCEVCDRSPTCGVDCGSCDQSREDIMARLGLTEEQVEDYMRQFGGAS